MSDALHPVLVGAFAVALVVGLAVASYGLMRFIFRNHITEETRDLAGAIVFRIAALHGLVLALVFAQELGEIGKIRDAAEREASLTADIYYDLRRYDEAETAPIRRTLARYAILVVDEEWEALGREDTLSPAAWQAWEAVYEAILDLDPVSERQARLVGIMLDDVRELSALRDTRENAALAGVSTLFLVAAIAGVMLTASAFFTWAPTLLNLTLICAFAGFAGLIIHFVVAFANPYSPPGRADSSGFERFLSDDVRAFAAESPG